MLTFKKAILPQGFKAAGVASGVKRNAKLDLALFYSELPARAGCEFTSNSIAAAPVLLCRKYLKYNSAFRAVIANSGNANCFTGAQGIRQAQEMTEETACFLAVKPQEILVASTGVINRKLPIDKIKKAIPALARGLSASGIDKAKKAIMTTDTFAKEFTVRVKIAGRMITICGIAKGAGMIAPNMTAPAQTRCATMLAFIFTDADISQPALDEALDSAVAGSFNCITVDGCMSTNDSVFVLANGAAGNTPIGSGSNLVFFEKALSRVCLELSKMIVKDAEGATKFITVKVVRARNSQEARTVALSIANSNLFKTAVFGENPNFGRIMAAVGASGVCVKENDLKIKVSPLKRKEISVLVAIGRGKGEAAVYTSDLTPEYIRINAEYN